MEQSLPKSPEKKFPKLYSFISFRKENDGGFVFNPHLYNERRIDDIGSSVVILSDGNHSVSEIVLTIGRQHHLPDHIAEQQVYSTFQELENYFAIHYSENRSGELSTPSSWDVVQHNPTDQNFYSAPLSIIWDVTYRCNLRCRHCLVNKSASVKEMDLDDAKKILHILKKAKIFTITFSGGEPLIRKDFFDILHYASDLHFGLRLNSNGLLLDKMTIEQLGEAGIYCYQVSLDGTRKTHDRIRGKKGSYTKAVEALKTASSEGYFTIMSMTLTKQNFQELQTMMDLAASIGVSTFKINGFVPAGRGKTNADDLTIPKEEIRTLCQMMADMKSEYEKKFILQWDSLYPWLLKPEVPPYLKENGGTFSPQLQCSAGYSNLVLAPDGTAYTCPYLTSYPLGNLLDTPFEKIWSTNARQILAQFRSLRQCDLEGKCKDCSYVPQYCNGGCRAMAYTVTGDFFAEDPSCWKECG